ncbi:hypothetical protein [Yunchengibacter salinarum]|uniref:hypothetical protein n=1 Tax=Yunchengibacter salinarum TaxID=3133399 RepID=UPI0035B59E28
MARRGTGSTASRAVLGTLITLALTFSATAEGFRLPRLWPDTQSRPEYAILRAALDQADGQHELILINTRSSQKRGLMLLKRDDAPYDIYPSGFSQSREKALQQVDIPLMGGLLGLRLLATRAEMVPRFAHIKNRRMLARRMILGGTASWPDSSIMRKNGLSVLTVSRASEQKTLNALWDLLKAGRVDALSQSVIEAQSEHKLRGNPDIRFVSSPLLRYRMPLLAYFRPGDPRAAILEQGLKRLYAAGGVRAILACHPSTRPPLQKAVKANPTVISLANPDLTPRLKALPERYILHLSDFAFLADEAPEKTAMTTKNTPNADGDPACAAPSTASPRQTDNAARE